VNVKDGIPADVKADAVILPGSLALNPQGNVGAWIQSFGGSRLIVPDEAAGVWWLNDFGQAADSAKALAEGQEIRPQSSARNEFCVDVYRLCVRGIVRLSVVVWVVDVRRFDGFRVLVVRRTRTAVLFDGTNPSVAMTYRLMIYF
jgi:hypothetical protein